MRCFKATGKLPQFFGFPSLGLWMSFTIITLIRLSLQVLALKWPFPKTSSMPTRSQWYDELSIYPLSVEITLYGNKSRMFSPRSILLSISTSKVTLLITCWRISTCKIIFKTIRNNHHFNYWTPVFYILYYLQIGFDDVVCLTLELFYVIMISLLTISMYHRDK